MRLLVDEIYPAAIAERLRDRRHDAIAVVERPDLRRSADRSIFEVAQHEGRALVSENIRDFVPLAREWVGRGEPHHDLVLVDPSKYHRGNARTIGRMVTALDRELGRHPSSEPSGLVLFL